MMRRVLVFVACASALRLPVTRRIIGRPLRAAAAVDTIDAPPQRRMGVVRDTGRTGRAVLLPAVAASWVAYHGFGALVTACRRISGIGASGLLNGAPDVLGLLFSVFASNTFSAMYEQQEAAHLAVYAEVSCARSLLEQTLLVLGGVGEPRCARALRAFRRYVDDLRYEVSSQTAGRLGLGAPRSRSLAERDRFTDPLEALLYATSVGAPSTHVYDTVRELRSARARRLGALQRKLPGLQFGLLYGLAAAILASIVATVAASEATIKALEFEAHGFGVMAFALVACLRVLQDIWSPTSGAYSVAAVLATLTEGLEAQLAELEAGF